MGNYQFLKDLTKAILPALVSFGGTMVMNNQRVQQAKGEANLQRDLANKQYESAYLNYKAQAEKNKLSQPTIEDDDKSNLPLYIGLGFGGVLILGVVIFALTRKRN